MNQNYGEVLCQAVDEIVRKRLEGISYDQTILCTVVDDSKREQGIYVVTNNNTTKFEAFSTVTNYRNKDNVYVQIPSGDWNQQKIIVAKKTSKNDEPFIYKRPFESLVDITGNLIKDNINDNLTGLLANSNEYESIILWTYNIDTDALSTATGNPHAAYTRLGIQAGFKSLINPFYDNDTVYNVTNGDYGLRLIITTIDEKTSKEDVNKQAEYVLYLNCADMNGNPYDFQSYYTQEKVFDISQIGKIQTMSLEFYQTPGTFKSAEGKLVPYVDFLGNSLPPNLFTDDVYISLGYDTSEFDSEMVYIYTLDSTTYSRSANPLSNNYKEVQLRWIHQQEDGSFKSITSNDKMDYEIRWYKYELGHASADEYSGVYWKNLSVQEVINGNSSYSIKDEDWKTHNEASATADQRYPQFFTTWLIPDTTLQEERIKAIILYNGQPYRSNLLVCENEDEVVNKATVDAVQALSINCEDNTYGNYRIYGQGGSLLDNAQSSIIREWKPMFKSSTGGLDVAPTELIEAESIEWIIPTKKTMIEIDDAFLENANVSYEDNDDARIHIKRIGVGVKGNDISGCNLQKYRIKSYYSQSYSDNTIQCKIVKDKITYTAVKELTFGIAGTSGTDCTFIIDFDNGVSAVSASGSSAVTVTARLYDYENTEQPNLLAQRTITWSWKTSDGQLTHRAVSGGPNCQREIIFNNRTADGSNYNILQASIPWGDGDLIAYLPIPIRASTQYAYMSGTSQVIYNSAGEILDLFANPYIVYDNSGNEVSSVNWSVKNNSSQENRYSPTITTDTRSGYQYLKPLSFYVENACEKVCVIGKAGNIIVWSQPILIMQNRYPSAMLNQWDGKLIIDKEGGSILAPRMAAGMKHTEDGTFSGVVLGNWGNTNSDNSLTSGETGLYGFDHGEQTYAFKQDGTAFIGKAGVGRISFNDSEPGVIESGAYAAGQTGMKINLATGTIDAHTFTLTAGQTGFYPIGGVNKTILIDTEANQYPLQIGSKFQVDWDGNLTASDAVFDGSGEFHGAIYATSGELGNLTVTGTLTGGIIYGTTVDAGIITGGSITGTSINNGKGSFSVDANGNLIATSATITGTVTATEGQIGNWGISNGAISNGATTLGADGAFGSSNVTITGGSLNIGSGQFTVDTKGNMIAESATIRGHVEATSGSIGGWYMYEGYNAPPNSPGQSSSRGWKALYSNYGSYWTVLDAGRDNVIAVGIPSSYVFNENDGGHNHAQLRITNGGDLIIGGSEAPFKVTQEGVMTATKGQIATWNIGTNSLWNGGSEASPTLYYGTSGITVTIGRASRSNIIFKAGSDFGVDNTGKVYANNLTITGGSFKIGNNFEVTTDGTLTAKSGTLGGWTVDAKGLRNLSNTAVLTPSQFKLGAFSVASSGAITTGTFSVSASGDLIAATGTIGGNWYITEGTLSTRQNAFPYSSYSGTMSTCITISSAASEIFQSYFDPNYQEGIFMGSNTAIMMLGFNSTIWMPSPQSQILLGGELRLVGTTGEISINGDTGKSGYIREYNSEGKVIATHRFSRGLYMGAE